MIPAPISSSNCSTEVKPRIGAVTPVMVAAGLQSGTTPTLEYGMYSDIPCLCSSQAMLSCAMPTPFSFARLSTLFKKIQDMGRSRQAKKMLTLPSDYFFVLRRAHLVKSVKPIWKGGGGVPIKQKARASTECIHTCQSQLLHWRQSPMQGETAILAPEATTEEIRPQTSTSPNMSCDKIKEGRLAD